MIGIQKKDVVIVIPIYKEAMTVNELISFRQCMKILNAYRIVLVKPYSLDITAYQKASVDTLLLETESFDDVFFQDIAGYNRLMLSESFYRRFSCFRYMLIYQLDAYVFRDELLDWCNKGYDYVGAPIIYNYEKSIGRVGNGGLSLRKMDTFTAAFDYKQNLLSAQSINIFFKVNEKPLLRIPLRWVMQLGWRNTFRYFSSTWKHNEDDFWSWFLDGSTYKLKKPTVHEALLFGFEQKPSECFRLSGEQMPFGCHAWEKYEYETFWKNYIN